MPDHVLILANQCAHITFVPAVLDTVVGYCCSPVRSYTVEVLTDFLIRDAEDNYHTRQDRVHHDHEHVHHTPEHHVTPAAVPREPVVATHHTAPQQTFAGDSQPVKVPRRT